VKALLVQSVSMFNISFFGRPSRNHCNFDNIHRTKFVIGGATNSMIPGPFERHIQRDNRGGLAGDRASLSLWSLKKTLPALIDAGIVKPYPADSRGPTLTAEGGLGRVARTKGDPQGPGADFRSRGRLLRTLEPS
jgi:hypothetical protein